MIILLFLEFNIYFLIFYLKKVESNCPAKLRRLSHRCLGLTMCYSIASSHEECNIQAFIRLILVSRAFQISCLIFTTFYASQTGLCWLRKSGPSSDEPRNMLYLPESIRSILFRECMLETVCCIFLEASASTYISRIFILQTLSQTPSMSTTQDGNGPLALVISEPPLCYLLSLSRDSYISSTFSFPIQKVPSSLSPFSSQFYLLS